MTLPNDLRKQLLYGGSGTPFDRRDRDEAEYFVAILLDALQSGGVRRQDPRAMARLISGVMQGDRRSTMQLRDLVQGTRNVYPTDLKTVTSGMSSSNRIQWERELIERTDDEHAAACCKHECGLPDDRDNCPVTAGKRRADMEVCDHE